MVPVKYNLRNVRARWVTTLLTVATTAVVVAVIVITSGMASGIEHALRISGDQLDVIVLRKGANDETSSTITEEQATLISTQPEIATDSNGKPLASSEFVTILTKPRRANGGTTNLIVRGIDGQGRLLRPGFKITEGRDLEPGVNEAITSVQMARRFENLGLGEQLEINKVNFTIVGYFEAGGSSAESEVWTDARDLTSAKRLPGAFSVVNFRAKDDEAKQILMERLDKDEQFKLKPVDEVKYFADQAESSNIIKYAVNFIGAFLTFAAMFAAANTMFSTVSSRGREIATLRALGFTRMSILLSFLLESVVLCLIGGVIGCLATLPFDGISSGTGIQFSELTFSFRFGWQVMLRGVILAILMGAVGGFFPALRACRIRVIDGLRQVV